MAQTQAPGADPVELAAELRSLLARNAAQAESDRRLPAEKCRGVGRCEPFQADGPETLGWVRSIASNCYTHFCRAGKRMRLDWMGRDDPQWMRMVGKLII